MSELSVPNWYIKVQATASNLHLVILDYTEVRQYPEWLYRVIGDSYGYAYVARHLERWPQDLLEKVSRL